MSNTLATYRTRTQRAGRVLVWVLILGCCLAIEVYAVHRWTQCDLCMRFVHHPPLTHAIDGSDQPSR